MIDDSLKSAPLGKNSDYISSYDASLIFPISRKGKRDEIGVCDPLPFAGFDTWNAFELSWLNKKGKPEVRIAQFDIACDSKSIIESKSFKLYLNSFNNTKFTNEKEVEDLLQKDIAKGVNGQVRVKLISVDDASQYNLCVFGGESLDELDVVCDQYTISDAFLSSEQSTLVEESLYSNLLKSNCLVTGQPDWGSIEIEYKGPKINREGLLKYIVSFRNHNEFHEQCVERVFMDIMKKCCPTELTVHARYTRRGGLDINPVRSTKKINPMKNTRMPRQ